MCRRLAVAAVFAACLGLCFPAWGSGGSVPASPPDPLDVVDSLRAEREFRKALARLSDLERERPGDVGVHWRTSLLWSDLGKAAGVDGDELRSRDYLRHAVAEADTALAVDSTSAWAHLAKALAEGRLARYVGLNERVRRSRAVIRHANRAIALDSTLAPAYHVRARWYREVATLNLMERVIVKAVYGGLPEASYDRAVSDFQTAIELESKIYHHLELGKTYLRMDRPHDARPHLRTALRLPPSDPFAPEYKAEARELLEEMK
jgi:tetratricopeptide (TPR) repeat protein